MVHFLIMNIYFLKSLKLVVICFLSLFRHNEKIQVSLLFAEVLFYTVFLMKFDMVYILDIFD